MTRHSYIDPAQNRVVCRALIGLSRETALSETAPLNGALHERQRPTGKPSASEAARGKTAEDHPGPQRTNSTDSAFIHAPVDSVGTQGARVTGRKYLFALSPERFGQSPALQAIRWF
jgi:hypothetical protein